MSGQLFFYYVGEDEAYFRSLEAQFTDFGRLPITFNRIYESAESKIQSLFLTIVKNSPQCVFIDFSKCTQDYLHLARLLARIPKEERPLMVGLLDLLTPQEVLNESLVTGVELTHYKGSEVFDVAFDVLKLIRPEQGWQHGFATADLTEHWEAGIFCKIGYVHPTGLHIETDFPVEVGEILTLNHCWYEKKIIPSRMVKVTNVSTKNLFYHFKYAVDVEFLFADPLVIASDTSPEDIADREKDREERIRRSKKQFRGWFEDNLSDSQEKIAKVLVIDREFHFYQNQKRTDKYSYVIRCLPTLPLDQIKDQFDRIKPQVIAVSLEEETGNPANDFAFLERLVEVIKGYPANERPFLVLFNTPIPSKTLQDQLGYDQLMAASNELSVEVLLRMASVFERKLLDKRNFESAEIRVYLKKTNSASVADFLIPLQISKLSETDLFFQSDRPLPDGTNLRLRHPIPFVINAQPLKTLAKIPEYQGLIHCLDESQKKELRRFVNSIFFRDHDAQVLQETEEFKQLNQLKLQERLDALKAAEEAAAKAEEAEKMASALSESEVAKPEPTE